MTYVCDTHVKFIVFKLRPLSVRLVGVMKNWKDRKDLVCPHVCLVGGVEKWEGKKHFFFFWLKKSRRKENVVYIN